MTKDKITLLLEKLRENVSYIKSGFRDDIYYKNAETCLMGVLNIIKLFMVSKEDSYYGCFLMNVSFEFDRNSNLAISTVVEDFNVILKINPILFSEYKLKEMIYLICHEIEQLISGHIAEKQRLAESGSEELIDNFDIATATEVNEKLDNISEETDNAWLSPPEKRWTAKSIEEKFNLKDVLPLESHEYYYDLISDSEADITEKSLKNSENIQSESGDVETTISNFIEASVDMMSDNQRGLLPDSVHQIINAKNKKAILAWKKLLKNYIGTITANKRKTRTRLNRRQPERYDLSGTMENKVLKIVVAIDTSGSVNDEQIAQIFTEIFSIVSGHKHEITVIECDAEIQRVYRVRKRKDLQKSVKGRGGTAFTPVIEYINENRYFRDALLIYFTDGFGEDWIPVPKTYRNLWVILGKAKNLSLENAYGRVVEMRDIE